MLPALLALMLVPPDTLDSAALPSADAVVAKMLQHDDERRAALQGYTGPDAMCSRIRSIIRKLKWSSG